MDPLGDGQKHRTSVGMMCAAIERGRSAWHCQTSELSLVRGRLRAAVHPGRFRGRLVAFAAEQPHGAVFKPLSDFQGRRILAVTGQTPTPAPSRR
ncbi:hypothetical protein [Streptomyces phaeoluteigriseus]|uniref:hypothetical protein n=1 Tax=Streptomyces phaeoluteigriseus TaxID=114686 RepID=UPI00338DF4E1